MRLPLSIPLTVTRQWILHIQVNEIVEYGMNLRQISSFEHFLKLITIVYRILAIVPHSRRV